MGEIFFREIEGGEGLRRLSIVKVRTFHVMKKLGENGGYFFFREIEGGEGLRRLSIVKVRTFHVMKKLGKN